MNNNLFEKTIRNLYENGDFSFKHLKEILSNSSKFIIETGEKPKTKKILLSYNIKQGKLYITEKVSEIKNNKSISEYVKTCDYLKEEIYNTLNGLEKNINSMNQDDQENIFGTDNNIYYSVDLLLKPEKVFDYNSKHFVILPDGHGEYDKSGKMIVKEIKLQVNKLNNFLNEWQNKLKFEKYNAEINSIRKLREYENKEYINYAINRIDNSLSSTNSYINNEKFFLNDNSNIDDYLLSRIYILLNGLLEKSNTGNYSPIVRMNIAKKLLGVKGIGTQDIFNKIDNSQKEYVRKNILNDFSKKEILKNSIKPIEDIIIEYSINLLKAIQAYLFLSNNSSYSRLSKQINNSINYLNTSGTFYTLKNELKNLKHLDKYTNNSEFSFYYDGNVYKPSGIDKPITEMLNVFKTFKKIEKEKNIIDENSITNIIYETVVKRGDKYCLLSKKTKRNLGCYKSKKAVKKREQQIHYFKSVKEMSMSSGVVHGAVSNLKDLESK